ncbi:MAG: hypothetical protein IPG60_01320 [Bacteroidetes bacterium]|nr:hypothetical protein [Bacteroidota bacterium]MBP7398158.1 hypothetical protein [Chitinophagales bacterium]MBK7108133.1 hypothetical protein [Bacteroidota bacterium]MBK8486433.1 hypothetical protein [Bacteroidota bacterium]MBK8683213.1 hypothetical protein [Bacteroidota bacterium]
MPVFDEREQPIPMMPLLVVTNIFPLVGILFYDLSFFAFFYLYWTETVLIGIFRWLKMINANKKEEANQNVTINGEPLTFKKVNSRVFMMGMYFFWRSAILMFYLVFIIVFVGLWDTSNTDSYVSFGRAITFSDSWMQITLLSYILAQLVDYILYIRDKQYQITSLQELANIFDGRTIVLHIVIVLGVFLSQWVSNYVFPDYPKAGTIAFASLFVVIKTIADVFAYKWQTSRQQVITSIFDKSPENKTA